MATRGAAKKVEARILIVLFFGGVVIKSTVMGNDRYLLVLGSRGEREKKRQRCLRGNDYALYW
jgi:hypothetical protein